MDPTHRSPSDPRCNRDGGLHRSYHPPQTIFGNTDIMTIRKRGTAPRRTCGYTTIIKTRIRCTGVCQTRIFMVMAGPGGSCEARQVLLPPTPTHLGQHDITTIRKHRTAPRRTSGYTTIIKTRIRCTGVHMAPVFMVVVGPAASFFHFIFHSPF